MRTFPLALLCAALSLPAAAAEQKPAAAAPTKQTPADADKALNAIGLSIAKSLEQLSLSPAEANKVLAGVREGLTGKAKPPDASAQEAIRNFVQARMTAAADKEKTRGATYREAAAKEKGAFKTEKGAIVVPIKEGTGPSPAATDKVKVNYTGTLVDGKVFDATKQHNPPDPSEFPLNGVIPCWTDALQKMKVGGKAKVVCPPEIAYGDRGSPPVIPPNATLTFEIELLGVEKAPPPPATTPAPAPAPAPKK